MFVNMNAHRQVKPTTPTTSAAAAALRQAVADGRLARLSSSTSAQAASRAVANPTQFGWNYFVDNSVDPPVAVFYANSSDETKVEDGSGGFKDANEI